jgi:integrase
MYHYVADRIQARAVLRLGELLKEFDGRLKIRLPAGSLMFPATPETGKEFDVTAPRNPRNFSKEFARRANLLGFGRKRFHDLRGIHATALLDTGIPVHTMAQRIGDDPATLLRNYLKRKRTKTADASLSSAMAASFLGS